MTHVSCCIVQVHVACVRFAREVSHVMHETCFVPFHAMHVGYITIYIP